MLGKLLLTVAIIVLAVYALRQRSADVGRGTDGGVSRPAPASGAQAGVPTRRHLMQTAAALVVALMLMGSALALWQGWARGRDVVTVEVANPVTGAVERFDARRTDVGERTIRTLDGRRIRVSEVERIIIRE